LQEEVKEREIEMNISEGDMRLANVERPLAFPSNTQPCSTAGYLANLCLINTRGAKTPID
jgi:hypothetical protein